MKLRLNIFLALTAFILASLACNFTARTQEPTAVPTIPVSTEAVENLQENLDSAAQDAQTGGPVTLVVNEAQLTSLVALELQKQEEPILENPQVLLRDGQVQLYGDVSQGNLTAPLQIFVSITVDAEGKPQYDITSAKLGPLPVPQALLDQFSARLDSVFETQFRSEADELYIDSITIADGTMTIQGHPR